MRPQSQQCSSFRIDLSFNVLWVRFEISGKFPLGSLCCFTTYVLFHVFLVSVSQAAQDSVRIDVATVRITVNSPNISIWEFPIFNNSEEVLLIVWHWYIWLMSKETSLEQSDFWQISCKDAESRILVIGATSIMMNGSLNICQQLICYTHTQTSIFIHHIAFSFSC